MTAIIEKRAERKDILKSILRELHTGASVDSVKERFKNLLEVGASELAEVESELIQEGIPAEEIKKLCDVHVAVFKDSLDNESAQSPKVIPGHPVHQFLIENRAIEDVVEEMEVLLRDIYQDFNDERLFKWRELHNKLMDIEKHYLRKENHLFPVLENHEFTGPSKVMWALHDDVRADLKEISIAFSKTPFPLEIVKEKAIPLLKIITDMIYKEEHILFPTAIDKLNEKEWMKVAQDSEVIGYTLVVPERKWDVIDSTVSRVSITESEGETINLSTGHFSPQQLECILNKLPFDITFVDEEDKVAYFSEGDRIFPRTKAIIGRKVQNCHPPRSVHVVERILTEFKNGSRDVAEFWIQMGEKFILIQYFALRDETGKYRGTLEVSQNAAKIRSLQGEKRLLDPL